MGRTPGLDPDGPEIKRLRVDLGLTAAQLAAKLGCDRKTVMAWEGQYRRIGDLTASRLAKALGVEVEDIATASGDDDTESVPEAKVPA